MRRVVLAALVLALGAVATGSASSSQQVPQLTCKYGFKYVTKIVHGHKKRVKVCKKKPKPKPPPPQADLDLEVHSTLDQVTAGNHVSYSFVVENKGPKIADGASLSVDLPPGKTDVYGYGGNGDSNACTVSASPTANHIECNFGTLGVESEDVEGESAYGVLGVRLEPTQLGDYTIAAKATASTADPTPANAAATTPLRVLAGPPSADLSVSLSSSPTPASVPDGFTETISVTNDGPTEATDVFVTVLLPQGASATQPAPVDDNLIAVFTGSCPYGYGFVTTALVCFDAVASGETRTASISISPSIRSPATLRVDAVVGSYTRDSNLANNRASGETALQPFSAPSGPDVRLSFDQPPSLSAGKPLLLQFQLRNLGLGDADNLTVVASTTPLIPRLTLALETNAAASAALPRIRRRSAVRWTRSRADARVRGAIYADSVPAGSYTTTVTVTSPDLSAPVTKTITFEVK